MAGAGKSLSSVVKTIPGFVLFVTLSSHNRPLLSGGDFFGLYGLCKPL